VATQSQIPLLPRFLRLATVNILSNITTPLAGLADIAFLGHLEDIRYLAGVALASVLFDYLYWTLGFLRMGTTGLTAQAMGRGDRQEALAVGLRNGCIALGAGIAIVLLQQPLRDVGFALLQGAEDIKLEGRAYFDARIWGALPTLLNFVLVGWFLGGERSGAVLAMSLVANAANIALNYRFIVQLGWGAAGAGWATALSQYAMLVAGLGFAAPILRTFQWTVLAAKLVDFPALQTSIALNGNLFVRTFALISTFAVFTNISSVLGPITLAANALLIQVTTLAAYFIDGMAFATESLAGLFRGEAAEERLRSLLWISGIASLVAGVGFALAFLLFPALLFGLLTDRRNLLDILPQYVPWLLPLLSFGSIAYMLDGYFLGLTAGRILRESTLIATVVGFLPLAIAALWVRNSHLLWCALCLFMAARAVTLGRVLPTTLARVVASRSKA
jgi:MATE family multidrug resistance protein